MKGKKYLQVVLLRTAFASSHRSWEIPFLEVFFLIASLTSYWLIGCLIACCLGFTCLCFFQFSSCNWFLVSYHCGWKIRWIWFLFSWIYWDTTCGLFWRISHVHLKRMCFLLSGNGLISTYISEILYIYI